MPKMKSVRGAVKRFRRTAGGKLMRHKAYRRHILTKKSSKRKRGLRGAVQVSSADTYRVTRMLAGL